MDTSKTLISCSVVLQPYHGSSMRSHTYLGVPIQRQCLSECDGVMVITTHNLLNALRDISYVGDGVPKPLKDIISGSTNSMEVVAATTQVPSFDDDIENPIYGYRCFGALSFIDIPYQTPTVIFDFRRDLLAVHSIDTPRTELFYQKWRRCGLRLENHFILIFRNISLPPPLSATIQSRNASPFTHYGFSDPSHTGSYHSSRGFQTPPLNNERGSESGYSRQGSYQPAHYQPVPLVLLNLRNDERGDEPEHSRTALPSLSNDRAGAGIEFFHPSSTEGSAPVVPNHQDSQTPNHTSDDINRFLSSSFNPRSLESVPHIEHPPHDIEHPTHDIELICREHGLSEDAINSAKFEKGEEKSLLRLVLNRQSMALVLVTLGFQTHLDAAYVGSKVVTLKGRQFVAGDIVKSFGWSPDSYRNKTTWYGWAKEAAKSQKWAASVPTTDSSQNIRNLYNIWLSIRSFWGPNGPAETERYPEGAPDSNVDEVRLVWKLKQQSVSANKAALMKHLVRCDSEMEVEMDTA